MAKLYAWTNFPTKFGDWGSIKESIKVGDEIKRDDLDCSDAEWEEFIERGLIREQKHPEAPDTVSPNEFFSSKSTMELAAEAQSQAEATHEQLMAAKEQAKATQTTQSKESETSTKASSTGGTGGTSSTTSSHGGTGSTGSK